MNFLRSSGNYSLFKRGYNISEKTTFLVFGFVSFQHNNIAKIISWLRSALNKQGFIAGVDHKSLSLTTFNQLTKSDVRLKRVSLHPVANKSLVFQTVVSVNNFSAKEISTINR